MSRGKIKFRTQNDEVCALYLLPPVYGGRAGGRSLFEIGKIIGYRQKLCSRTKLDRSQGSPPRFTGSEGDGSQIKICKIIRISSSDRAGREIYQKTPRVTVKGTLSASFYPAQQYILFFLIYTSASLRNSRVFSKVSARQASSNGNTK